MQAKQRIMDWRHYVGASALAAVSTYFEGTFTQTDPKTRIVKKVRFFPSPESITERVRYLLDPKTLPLVWEGRYEMPVPGIEMVCDTFQ